VGGGEQAGELGVAPDDAAAARRSSAEPPSIRPAVTLSTIRSGDLPRDEAVNAGEPDSMRRPSWDRAAHGRWPSCHAAPIGGGGAPARTSSSCRGNASVPTPLTIEPEPRGPHPPRLHAIREPSLWIDLSSAEYRKIQRGDLSGINQRFQCAELLPISDTGDRLASVRASDRESRCRVVQIALRGRPNDLIHQMLTRSRVLWQPSRRCPTPYR
jgi:hypothetical protein